MMQWIVSSSVLILVVIALRYVLRGKLSLRMQYALWLLVLVRLLVPVSFGASDLSVMNAVPERAPTVQQGTYKQDIVGERNDAPTNAGTVGIPAQSMNEAAPPNLVQNVTTATVTAPTVEKTDWARIAKTVWLAGTAALGLVFLAVNLRFGKKLRRSRERVEETDACLPVYESGETDTPCLFGVAKPSIYVTPDTRTEAETLRYALAHEQTHYRHGDNLWAVLRGVCLALHWYNPLVWWAAELSRRDAELACDEATIRRIGESERAAYGRTLIRMTCEKRPALLVTATMMTDSGKGLKERISLLVKKPKTAAYTAVAVLLIAGLSVACTFTGGRENAELAEPFGKHYVEEATVACAPGYMNDPIGGELEVVADRDSDDVRTLLLKRMDNEEEQLYETVAEVTLTKEEFDVRFNSKTDGPTEWLVDGLSAAKLRRENAKAWLCTSSTADENGWANRVYFLQQKDGTLYLVMAAEQPENQNRNFVCWVFRLTEKPVPTYDSMEAYALSVINALKQPNGYTYYILPEKGSTDGLPLEVTEAAADVRVTELEKRGDCTDLAPDGVLELWSFSYEVKPEDKAGALPDRFFWVGGNNITDDGYISDGFYYYLTMLRTDGEPSVYRLLDSRMADDGLWDKYRIEDVCTPEALARNRKTVIDFYNIRRRELLSKEPNAGHYAIRKLEDHFDVEVVTQNIDDLHERAGSTHVTHLHGELRKLRSSADESLVVPIEGWEQHLDDRAPDGSLLRPFVVFFGEGVPMFDRAARIAATADLLIVVGTSLAVYPAASLVRYIRPDVPVYLIDPNEPDMSGIRNPTELIRTNSAQGTPLLVDRLIDEFGNR